MESINSNNDIVTVYTKQQQIAENAKRLPNVSFTSLAYHMDIAWMFEAYMQTRSDGATGVDGVTSEEYEKNLKSNLENLLDRAKSGKYRAPAIRRVYIPKGSGNEMRPLGIPTYEDKILQRAVKMLLEPIYEQDFYDCSYGFRPNKSQHQALQYLWKETMMMNGWLIDLDIRKYFDSIDHNKLMGVVRQRVNDGVITRLIGKWLNAGIMEDGNLHYSESGTPQGGVISPLLSNIYLHEILDKWFVNEVKPRMSGKVFLIRFADDAIIGFEHKVDAERVMHVLPKRFAKYGLTLHPEKTKLIKFTRPNIKSDDNDSDTFNFLGFTHFWSKSVKGTFVVRRKTSKDRLARAIKNINKWCKDNRHQDIKYQHDMLSRKARGHYGYYGVTGNFYALKAFYWKLTESWMKWLGRRSDKDHLTAEKFRNLMNIYSIPLPRIVHTNI
jgi:group II intron reverse transcriptase/maturase